MSSETGQQAKPKKKRAPKKYNHNLPPPMDVEDGREQYRIVENGRKPLNLSYKKLEQFMWTNPTLEMTALFFDCGTNTIEVAIKQRYALTFSEFRSKNLMQTRKALVQKAIQMALEKDNIAALIFALKNLAGWSDSVQLTVQPNQTVQLKYNLNEPPALPEPIDVTPSKDPSIE